MTEEVILPTKWSTFIVAPTAVWPTAAQLMQAFLGQKMTPGSPLASTSDPDTQTHLCEMHTWQTSKLAVVAMVEYSGRAWTDTGITAEDSTEELANLAAMVTASEAAGGTTEAQIRGVLGQMTFDFVAHQPEWDLATINAQAASMREVALADLNLVPLVTELP